jgi:hypothetical protein
VPPHWFVPVRSSPPESRKQEVKDALGGKGKVDKFWKGSDGNLYAYIKDCPGLDEDEDMKRRMKVSGPLVGLEREV